MLELIVLGLFPGLVLLAATTDVFTYTIPNKLNLVLVALFFIAAPLAGLSLEMIAWHTGAALAVLVLTFILFMTGTFGGGDAKLVTAVMLWFGPAAGLDYLLYASLLGGLITAAIVLGRTQASSLMFSPRAAWLVPLLNKEMGIPYGIALGGAAMYLWPQTFWFEMAIGF
ncbi:MAG: prepilin peptidase [Pseudomonadota bacterium]